MSHFLLIKIKHCAPLQRVILCQIVKLHADTLGAGREWPGCYQSHPQRPLPKRGVLRPHSHGLEHLCLKAPLGRHAGASEVLPMVRQVSTKHSRGQCPMKRPKRRPPPSGRLPSTVPAAAARAPGRRGPRPRPAPPRWTAPPEGCRTPASGCRCSTRSGWLHRYSLSRAQIPAS